MKPILTLIVERAMVETVTSIGQLTHRETLELERAVRHNYLSKGKGGPYPVLKTVYAHPGFDFEADRRFYVDRAMRMADLEKSLHLGPYHPIFSRKST